jgi:hypothetical protein
LKKILEASENEKHNMLEPMGCKENRSMMGVDSYNPSIHIKMM